MNKKLICRSVASALPFLMAGAAQASGFQLLEQNASGLGNSYAGSAAVSENASIIFFNPAGMTRLQKREVSLGGNYIKPSYKFSNDGTVNTPAPAGSDGADAGDPALVPNSYGSYGLTDNLYFGVGVSVPFGLKTEYSPDWAGRFQALSFDIKTLNINPSLAYKIGDRFSLGFGLNWQNMEAQYIRQAAVNNAVTQNTTISLNASSEAWGWNTGVLFKASDNMDIGLSYRSKVKHKLEGMLTSSNQLVSPDVMAEARITLPDTMILSVRQKLSDDWEMLGDISHTYWSRINTVPIVRTSGANEGTTAQTLDAHFRNTWRLALGATQTLDSAWKVKYGIAYDQSPVRSTEERLVSLPDNDRIWVSLGAQWKMDKSSTVDIGAAYLYLRETKIDNNQSTSGRGRVAGVYSGNVTIFGAQYSLAF
ncbi:OmpP1/FadL family transporter [Viridibacterium curvum]|uniref:Outer membrane protein transport protein n=1 Tax=Viridibacterium curvum TaxID=1101404 RepID=A0ABP9R3I3_9RHOO